MSIDCKASCNYQQGIIDELIKNIKNNENDEQIQQAAIARTLCIIDCERRNQDATRDGTPVEPLDTHRGSGSRKKYIGKTKNFKSSTRRRIHRTRTKTARRRRR
jgi:hypothetical protein